MTFPRTGIFLGAMIFAVAAAWGHGGATGVVKERMDAMSAMGRATKTIGEMLKGAAAYEPEALAAAAGRLAAHAGPALTGLFPEGSLKAPSEAGPAVWTDRARFAAIADELQVFAEDLETLAATGAERRQIARAFGKVAGTCKTCHEAIRIRK